jgi:nicotinate-nucleotide adenylyltransferase
MRLGLFGGSFDPIHLGHLVLAESCRIACALDQVWFVVTASPPHKLGRQRASVAHRLEMARIAVAGNPAFDVSEIEAHNDSPSYSYQTVERLQLERPDDQLFFLIGADSLADLPTWRHPDRLARSATILVVNRPGAEVPQLPQLGPEAKPLQLVESPLIGISSTDLRHRAAHGQSIRYLVPRGVQAYIEAHHLYTLSEPAP